MLYTREQALDIFAVEYCRQQRLAIPVKAIKPLIEGKMVETHNAFYLRDTNWKLDKRYITMIPHKHADMD